MRLRRSPGTKTRDGRRGRAATSGRSETGACALQRHWPVRSLPVCHKAIPKPNRLVALHGSLPALHWNVAPQAASGREWAGVASRRHLGKLRLTLHSSALRVTRPSRSPGSPSSRASRGPLRTRGELYGHVDGASRALPQSESPPSKRTTPTASGTHLQPRLGLRLPRYCCGCLDSKCELPFAIAIATGRGPNTSTSNEDKGNGI